MQGSDEEAQGLLAYAGYAQQSMKGVADRAGGMIGGHMGFAMQAATISTQAWITFFVLLVLGGLLMAASFASLPMLLLAPQKFACVFTTGSACILGALCSLKGFNAFVAHLTTRERRPLSIGFLGSMTGTLWASMWCRSGLLTIAFSVAQISSLLWFFVSYIPGGAYAMGLVCDFLKGALRHVCCNLCASKASVGACQRPWSSSVHSTLAMYDAGGGALELKRRIEALFQQLGPPCEGGLCGGLLKGPPKPAEGSAGSLKHSNGA